MQHMRMWKTGKNEVKRLLFLVVGQHVFKERMIISVKEENEEQEKNNKISFIHYIIELYCNCP